MDFTFCWLRQGNYACGETPLGGLNDDNNLNVFGIASFFDANEGYFEAGFGIVEGEDEFADIDYKSITGAFTSRYGAWLSNSIRFVGTFDQDRDNGSQQTADGQIILLENSLITSLPSTLVPYANFWVGLIALNPLLMIAAYSKTPA